MPDPDQIEAETAGARRSRMTGLGDASHGTQLLEHLGGALPCQVTDHSIIGKYCQLNRRKERCQKPVVLLIAVVLGVRSPPLLPGPPGARRPVVAIRYIGIR